MLCLLLTALLTVAQGMLRIVLVSLPFLPQCLFALQRLPLPRGAGGVPVEDHRGAGVEQD